MIITGHVNGKIIEIDKPELFHLNNGDEVQIIAIKKKKESADLFCGIWEDDKQTAKEMVDDIYNARHSRERGLHL